MTDAKLTARRQVAMQALESNGEASYPLLEELLRDTDETVRLNAIQVIRFIGTAQARALLESALHDASPSVRQAAVAALQGMSVVNTPPP